MQRQHHLSNVALHYYLLMSCWLSLHLKDHLWWTPTWSPPPSCCTKHVPNLNCIWTCWFLGYTTLKTFEKTNIVVYWSLMGTTIHMPSKSWTHHIIIFLLIPPCNNRHANIPNPFHVCTPCLWPTGCVKPIVLLILWHGHSKIGLFVYAPMKCLHISSLPPSK